MHCIHSWLLLGLGLIKTHKSVVWERNWHVAYELKREERGQPQHPHGQTLYFTFLADLYAANRHGLAISLLRGSVSFRRTFLNLVRNHFILIQVLINTYLCRLGLPWEAASALSFGDHCDPPALWESNLTHHRTSSHIPLLSRANLALALGFLRQQRQHQHTGHLLL